MTDSRVFIEKILKEINKFEKNFLFKNSLDLEARRIPIWKQSIEFALKLLEENSIKYCITKASDLPFARMGDVDLLVENNKELKKLYKIFNKKKFEFEHVPFNNDLKMTVRNEEENIELDFYPDALWGEIRYEKQNEITKNRRLSSKHGIEMYIPKAEHEIHIVASHHYYHARLTLNEVISTSKIILEDNPNFLEIIDLAKRFHMENGCYVLLSACDWMLKLIGFDVIPSSCIDELMKDSRKNFHRIVSSGFKWTKFPISYSVNDLLLSSFSKFTSRDLDNTVTRSDELISFLKHNRVVEGIHRKILPYNYSWIEKL